MSTEEIQPGYRKKLCNNIGGNKMNKGIIQIIGTTTGD
jgi:hypothetical protein